MIHPERIWRRKGGDETPSGNYVLYWMQQSQRVEGNHALEYAIEAANARGLPVLIGFGLSPRFPGAKPEHYGFMLAGLRETAAAARIRGLGFELRYGEPPQVALELARGAALAVLDRGYLRVQREWRDHFVREAACPVVEVESDAVVPVETVSSREAYSAHTLRPAIRRELGRFLVPLEPRPVRVPWSLGGGDATWAGEGSGAPGAASGSRAGSAALPPAGYRAARERLLGFLDRCLCRYPRERRDPASDLGSGLSPYLHFGQISVLNVALAVVSADAPEEARSAFLEELVVRRELAINYVHYNAGYDTYAALPEWSRRSLEKHAKDRRTYAYGLNDLEAAATHDPYWNAAQVELLRTGRMHSYMRMYWGKKILEWTPDPEAAFCTALELNNRLELDGRDPNGFAGVAWCFGKHDRPWAERPVFGVVRTMTGAGLQRKFNMDAYLARVGALEAGG